MGERPFVWSNSVTFPISAPYMYAGTLPGTLGPSNVFSRPQQLHETQDAIGGQTRLGACGLPFPPFVAVVEDDVVAWALSWSSTSRTPAFCVLAPRSSPLDHLVRALFVSEWKRLPRRFPAFLPLLRT